MINTSLETRGITPLPGRNTDYTQARYITNAIQRSPMLMNSTSSTPFAMAPLPNTESRSSRNNERRPLITQDTQRYDRQSSVLDLEDPEVLQAQRAVQQMRRLRSGQSTRISRDHGRGPSSSEERHNRQVERQQERQSSRSNLTALGVAATVGTLVNPILGGVAGGLLQLRTQTQETQTDDQTAEQSAADQARRSVRDRS